MSTILKALKKLEHDKQVEAAHQRAQDPLAPAPPPQAREDAAGARRITPWLIGAGLAGLFAIGLGIGVYTASSPESQDDARPRVLARRSSEPASPAVAAPPRGVREPVTAVPPAPAPIAGIERVSRDAPMASATPVGAAATPVASAPTEAARGSAPDPWEQAAAATVDEAETDAAPESPELEGTPISTLPVVTLPPEPAAVPAAAPAPTPGATAMPEQTAASVATTVTAPSAALEQTPAPAPPESAAASAAPAVPPGAVQPEAPARSMPGIAEVVVPEASAPIEVKVLKTVWHPKPDRRLAQLALSDREGLVEVREGDRLEGYVVEEITPSTVVLSKGSVTTTRRVGR